MLDFVLGLIGTLLYPLFSIIFVFLDGIQSVFYSFAGIGDMTFSSQTITATNEGGETNTGIVYYLFQNSLVKNMLFSIMLLALFLVIIFTVMAFIKNAYAAKQKGWKEIVGNSIKGLANFILIPVCCLLGVWLANILLQAINGATSNGGASKMSRKLFVAAAYNANEFRKVNDEQNEQGLTWLELTADSEKVNDLIDWAKNRKMLDSGKAYNWEKIEKGQTNGYYANIVDEIYANTNVSIYEQFSVGKWYQVWSINYLVLIVGGIFMLYVLCALSFAMVRRLFLLIILFIISPGVCAMYPLDEGKAVNSWKGEFIKLVLSAYGAVAGMNIFFSIMPLIDKIELGTGAGNVAMNFSGINTIIQIFILVVGLLCVKEVIGLISGFVGGEDAFAKGSSTMKATTGAMKKYAGGAVKKSAGAFAKARAQATTSQHKNWATVGHLFKNFGTSLANDASKLATGIDIKDVKKTYKDTYKDTKDHVFDGYESRTLYMKKKQDKQFASFFKNKDGSDRKKAYEGRDLNPFFEFLKDVKDPKARDKYLQKMADFNNPIIANKRGAIRDEDGNMILKKVDADGTKHYKSGKIGGGHLQTVANLQEKLDAYEGNAKSMKYQERSLEPIIRAFRESQASSNVKTFATQMGIDISDVSLRNFEEAMTRAIRNNMFVGNGDNARLLNKNALMTRLTEREKFTGEEVAKASESVAKAMQKFNDMLTYNAADNALHDAVESLTKDVMDSAKKLKIDKELDISGLEKSLKDASKTISETFDKLKKFEDIK